MKILVTGGLGFIGSNFIRHMLNKYPTYKIINFDKVTYCANFDNLKDIKDNSNYTFVEGDIADYDKLNSVVKTGFDAVINFAAETHVDRSIYVGPREFVTTNVIGTHSVLEAVRHNKISRLIAVSTDEIYGSLELEDETKFNESSNFAPNSPYAATKATGDLLSRAYFKTYKTPVIITRCSNNYGPYQFPEKLIPFFVMRALNNEKLPLYGDGKNIRDWIHVLDHCEALDIIIHKGKVGEIYNISADNERSNMEIAKIILKNLRKPESLITFVEDRLSHDRKYSIDSSKIRKELNWKPRYNFKDGIAQTIRWYEKNKKWIENIKKRGAELNIHIKLNTP